MGQLKNEAHAVHIDILQQTYLVKRGCQPSNMSSRLRSEAFCLCGPLWLIRVQPKVKCIFKNKLFRPWAKLDFPHMGHNANSWFALLASKTLDNINYNNWMAPLWYGKGRGSKIWRWCGIKEACVLQGSTFPCLYKLFSNWKQINYLIEFLVYYWPSFFFKTSINNL